MHEPFFAHSGAKADRSDWQLLDEHLRKVGVLARSFAEVACPTEPILAESAYATGLLHDLGKYRPEFQLMIRSAQVQKEKTYHKQAGAAKAALANCPAVAFAIAGHDLGKYRDEFQNTIRRLRAKGGPQ